MPIPIDICVVCGSKSTAPDKQLSNYLNLTEDFSVLKCAECGMMWLNPQPTADEYKELYSGSYFGLSNDTINTNLTHRFPKPAENYQTLVEFERMAWYDARLERLSKISPEGGNLLDVGAATGDFCARATLHGWNVTGIELSSDACKKAKEKFGIDVLCCDLFGYNTSNRFSVVHLSHVFEHIISPREALSRIRELLIPGGLLVIEVPNQRSSWVDIFIDTLRHRSQMDRSFYSIHHPYFYSRNLLTRLLESHGFEVVSARTYFPERWRSAPSRRALGLIDKLGDLAGGHGRNIEVIGKLLR